MKKEKVEALTKYKEMLLFKINVFKDNKRYVDYWLCWSYENKICNCRITPTFFNSYRCMVSVAIEVSDLEKMLSIAKAILR